MLSIEKSDQIFKIIVIGQQGTGKTALLYNYIKGEFKQQYNVTVGVQFCSSIVQIQENIVRLQIWDTAGQQTFKSIVRSFYKGASAVLLTYAIDDQQSFNALRQWIKQVKQHANQQACLFLVGTKVDIRNKRKVQAQTAQKFVKQIGGVCFIETSAKTGENIDTLFKMAANIMYKKYLINAKFRQLVNPMGQNQNRQTRLTKIQQMRQTRMTSFSLRRPIVNDKDKKNKKCC